MTTNQTIDGVPREDLRELHVMLCSDPDVQDGSVYGDIRERLRALLDGPVCKVCNDTGKMHEPGQDPGSCSACLERPAPQPQGEPVAWLNVATGHVTTSAVVVMDWDDEKEQVQSLYAEQPAPVAFPGYPPVPEDRKLPAPVAAVHPTHANPPPGTEPSGTHHDNDGLDEWRKP